MAEKLQFRSNGNGDVYVYVEAAGGASGAIGGDGSSGLVCINTSSSPNAEPDSTTSQISLDPSANGGMIFRPHGTGQSEFITGDVQITQSNLKLPHTANSGATGCIFVNSPALGGYQRFISFPDDFNIYIGTETGTFPTIVGATYNIAIGTENTLDSLTGSATQNIAIGRQVLDDLETGNANVALGNTSLSQLVNGSNNTALGSGSGGSYTSNESSNIIINNPGVGGDNGVIRIGTNGTHTRSFLQGIHGVTPAGASQQLMIMDSAGQMGTTNGGAFTTNSYTTDSGSATPAAGIIQMLGGSNLNSSGAGNSVTFNLDNTVSISGNFTTTAGNINVNAGDINLPNTNGSATQGAINLASTRFMHNQGDFNTYLGSEAGAISTINVSNSVGIGYQSLTTAGVGTTNNTGVGYQTLPVVAGNNNTAVGYRAGFSVSSGGTNTLIGVNAGIAINTGSNNTCVGFSAGAIFTSGSNNTLIGYGAGSSSGTGSGSNIYIRNVGASESNTMRIGTQGNSSGEQNRSFIAGIVGATNAGASTVPYIETATGQLATVPGGAVTMNTGTQSLSISSDASATTVNVATGSAAKTVTVGSTNSSSSLALGYGTSDFTLASATGTVMSALDTGEITYPLQPAFLAYLGSAVNNVTGNGTGFTLGTTTALTEVFDQNGDFNTNGTFTAPVTGRYHISAGALVTGCTIASNFNLRFISSNRTYLFQLARAAGSSNFGLNGSALIDMDAADTLTVQIEVTGEAADTDDVFGSSSPTTFISGYLAC